MPIIYQQIAHIITTYAHIYHNICPHLSQQMPTIYQQIAHIITIYLPIVHICGWDLCMLLLENCDHTDNNHDFIHANQQLCSKKYVLLA